MGSTTKQIELLMDSDQFFRELVTSANRNQGYRLEPELEIYLIELLQDYLISKNLFGPSSESKKEGSPALYVKLTKALEIEGQETRSLHFRKMGDFALYISGFFSESLNRKLVDLDYYIEMGSSAYSTAGKLTAVEGLQSLCISLAQRFSPLVNILSEVSDKAGMQTDRSLLSLYENWLSTGNESAKKKLQEEGFEPIPIKIKTRQ